MLLFLEVHHKDAAWKISILSASFVVNKHRKKIVSDFVKQIYFAYFEVNIGK